MRTGLFAIVVVPAVFVAGAETIQIGSSLDGRMQPALLYTPPATQSAPAPLLVHLHSWSATYDKSGQLQEALEESRKRGWVFLSPNFRGPNNQPEACGSRYAVQDILDAVEYVRSRAKIDARRIYLLGGSGGGHATLLLAARAPHLWAAASAWCPITDLAAWHRFSHEQGTRYARMLENCCGGPPESPQADAEYRSRSPLFHLREAGGLAIALDTGIEDGHKGSVPVSQTLLAFNELASANGHPESAISAADIATISGQAKIPDHLAKQRVEEPGRKRAVLFRRTAGPVQLTIFDGAHETDFATAIRWLERHSK